jgi:cyclopropane fatty-acyl-phospholipid synthase-like methyltransferase
MSKQVLIAEEVSPFIKTLGIREQYRDQYWQKRDPICEDRLLWRAQTFRHMVHLLPNQSILELGSGQGLFTRQLLRVSRGENPITLVTFNGCIPILQKYQDAIAKVNFQE